MAAYEHCRQATSLYSNPHRNAGIPGCSRHRLCHPQERVARALTSLHASRLLTLSLLMLATALMACPPASASLFDVTVSVPGSPTYSRGLSNVSDAALTLKIPAIGVNVTFTGLELFGTDTRFFGSALFVEAYNEVGFSFGRTKIERKTLKDKIRNCLSDIRVGLTYLIAKGSEDSASTSAIPSES